MPQRVKFELNRSSMATMASTTLTPAARQWWWWVQLLPAPIVRACERLLMRLVALWLRSPLRRMRLGGRRSAPLLTSPGVTMMNEDPDGVTIPFPASSSSAAGLFNLGNTCFVNATLQCLAALPGLRVRVAQEMAALGAVETAVGDESTGRQRRTAETLLALLASLGTREAVRTDDDANDGDDDIVMADDDDDDNYRGEDASPRRRPTRFPVAAGGRNIPTRETLRVQLCGFLDAAAETTALVARSRETQEQQDAEVRGRTADAASCATD